MKGFRTPKDVVFGIGALEYLKQVNGEKAFIVSDKVMKDIGSVDKVASFLKEAGLSTEEFCEVMPDPDRDVVEKGAKKMQSFAPDWIVALGGGSSIDAAKAMWYFYEYPDITWETVFTAPPALRNKAKLIAIATTSGTGSEVTCASVVTNKLGKVHFKEVIATPEILSDIAIVDPELMASMPPKVTAATGMDALTHAIESYTSIATTVVDQALAVSAINNTFKYLPKAYADGRNLVAREAMASASMMAAMAFTNSFLGIVHALAHQLGTEFGVPHGAANSLMLPYVINYNSIACADAYAEIAEALNLDFEDDKDGTNKLIEAIFELQNDIGLASNLKDYGITETQFNAAVDTLSQNSMNDITVHCNPRVPSIDDMKTLYTKAFSGEL